MEHRPAPQIPQLQYRARFASSAADVTAAQRLRAQAFGRAADGDAFDAQATHILVEDVRDGTLAGTARLLLAREGAELLNGYSAQFYALRGLAQALKPRQTIAELGRFCTDPLKRDPDILRLIWAKLAGLIARENVTMILGCASFKGTAWRAHAPALAALGAHQLPAGLCLPKAPETVDYPSRLRGLAPSPEGMRAMPPLLRSYLTMGGKVSDHAVVDRAMGTLHVLTCLDLKALPESRARALRAMAQ